MAGEAGRALAGHARDRRDVRPQAVGFEELSDEDIEKVAGGIGSTTVGTVVGSVSVAETAAAAAAVI